MLETTRETGWLAVVAVTLGIFSIVTTEIMPIGLLTAIAAEFRISEGAAGWTMTLPGVVAALTAPLVTVSTGRFDRRLMLCALTALLVLADLLAAIAPAYWVLLVARALLGVVIGGFWSIGSGLAARLVRKPVAATSVIFAAVPLGSVLGVPAGTLIGELAGWRTTFTVMGGLTAGVLLCLLVFLPALPPGQVTAAATLRGLLRRPGVRSGLILTFLVVTAHFGTYTYVTPFLEQAGFANGVSGILLLYGAAGVAGNFAAGWAVARNLRRTFVTATLLLAVSTLALPLADGGVVALLLTWGFAYGAVPVCSQTWFMKAAPQTPEAATVVFTSSFQASISVGAVAGGVVVDLGSVSLVMLCGGIVALAATAVLLLRQEVRPAEAT